MALDSKLIICADDFGQNRSISLAIAHLVQEHRLNAVSCMVTGVAWQENFSFLLSHRSNIQLGLHLNLTEGQALTHRPFDSLRYLIFQTHRLLPLSRVWLKTEIRSQILKFKSDMGFWPQFIDGHQHVHQLPIIRDVLLECVRELGFKPWFRTTYHFDNRGLKSKSSWKKWVLLCLGGQSFYRLLKRYDYMGNSHFAGDYRFGHKKPYREVFLAACHALAGEGLIMCHPGLDDVDENDTIRHSRMKEFAYFNSAEYLKDLES